LTVEETIFGQRGLSQASIKEILAMKAALILAILLSTALGRPLWADDKDKHRPEGEVQRITRLQEDLDTRLRDEQGNFPVHLEIGDCELDPPGEDCPSTFVLFSFIGPDGDVLYGCGNDRGVPGNPFVNALQMDENARHAVADLTGILGDEIPCGGAVPQSVSVKCDSPGENERHDEGTTLVITPDDKTRTRFERSEVNPDCIIEVDGVEYESTQAVTFRSFERTRVRTRVTD
jgi:hypothetical protein